MLKSQYAAHILALWEAKVRRLSPAAHVRWLTLLDKLPAEIGAAELFGYLAPILAQSKLEQAMFHELAEEILRQIEREQAAAETAENNSQTDTGTKTPDTPTNQPETQKTTKPKDEQKYEVGRNRNDNPPYIWQLTLPDLKVPAFEADLQTVLFQFRQRTSSGSTQFDLQATINHAVKKTGFAEFQFQETTQQSEYLFLINRLNVNDHRALLYNDFYKFLQQSEVIIDRFFFDGDIRLCRNEVYTKGLTISDLVYKFPARRVFVFSDGYALFNPMTGKLASWLENMSAWKSKMLVSPATAVKFGKRELALFHYFTIIPSTYEGIRTASKLLGDDLDTTKINPNELKHLATAKPLELGEQGDLMAELESYLNNPDLVLWVAVCYYWPELYYDLTKWLGTWLETKLKRPLVTASNLFQVTHLPWFTEGVMPNPVRSVCKRWLVANHLAILSDLGADINTLLEENEPTPGSVAHDTFAMRIAMSQQMFNPDPQQGSDRIIELQEFDITTVIPLKGELPELGVEAPDSWKDKIGISQSTTEEQISGGRKLENIEKSIDRPLKTVIVYGNSDTDYKTELVNFLNVGPVEEGLIEIGHDAVIDLDNKWSQTIRANLHQAELILVLVSINFASSKVFNYGEFELALERGQKGDCIVIPIILKPVPLGSPFMNSLKGFESLPKDKPMTNYRFDQYNEVWSSIIDGISSRVKKGKTNTTIKLQDAIKPIRTFIIYSHKDRAFKNVIAEYLQVLVYERKIDLWHDGLIDSGAELDKKIKHELNAAELVLLLVSADSLASDYIRSVELKIIFNRMHEGLVRIVPIIIKSCPWNIDPMLNSLQALPQSLKPVNDHKNQEVVWVEIVRELSRMVDIMIEQRAEKATEQIAYLSNAEIKKLENASIEAAIAAREAGDFKAAIEQLEAIVKVNPKNIEGSLELGLNYREAKYYEKAVSLYQKLLKSDKVYVPHQSIPSILIELSQVFYAIGDLGQVERTLSRAMMSDEDIIPKIIAKGQQLQMSGKLKEAEFFLRKAVSFESIDVRAHLALGICLREAQQYNEAIKRFRQAAKLAPDDSVPLIELGITLRETKNYQDATEHLVDAVRIDPKNAHALYELGVTYHRDNKYSEAIDVLKRAVELGSDLANHLLKTVYEDKQRTGGIIDGNKILKELLNLDNENEVILKERLDKLKRGLKLKIAEGRIEEALDVLLQYSDEALLVKGNFTSAKWRHMQGLTESREYMQAQARAANAALHLINKLKVTDIDKSLSNSLNPMDSRKGKSSVFISYNHADSDTVDKMQALLEKAGFDTDRDLNDMEAGEKIQDFIDRMIKTKGFVLSVVSRNSLSSGWIGVESNLAKYAQFFGVNRFIPVRIDDAMFDPRLSLDVAKALKSKMLDVDALIQESKDAGIPYPQLEVNRKRLEDQRLNIPNIIHQLQETLVVDIAGTNFDRGMEKVIETLKS